MITDYAMLNLWHKNLVGKKVFYVNKQLGIDKIKIHMTLVTYDDYQWRITWLMPAGHKWSVHHTLRTIALGYRLY